MKETVKVVLTVALAIIILALLYYIVEFDLNELSAIGKQL